MKKPSDPTIAEKFNTYRPACRQAGLPPAGKFADYKEKVIDLLKRVTTVSVGTQTIVRQMADAKRVQ